MGSSSDAQCYAIPGAILTIITMVGYLGQYYVETQEIKRDDYYKLITNDNSKYSKGIIATDTICIVTNVTVVLFLACGVMGAAIGFYVVFFIAGVVHFVLTTILLADLTSCNGATFVQKNNAIYYYNYFPSLSFRRKNGITNSTQLLPALDEYLTNECKRTKTYRIVFYCFHAPIFIPFVILPLIVLICAGAIACGKH